MSENNKLLTVSVAAYNVQDYIRQGLDPFCQEEIRDKVEVLIIDDGGSDDTLSIAMEYAEKYPEIFRPIHKDNGGWGSTVNVGIREAKGKYFRLMDGDDYFDNKALKEFIRELETQDADIVTMPYTTVDCVTGKPIQIFSPDTSLKVGELYLLSDIMRKVIIALPSTTIKTKCLQDNNIQILENCFYTDNEFDAYMYAYTRTLVVLNTNVYMYRINRDGQSTSTSFWRKHFKDHEKVAIRILQFLNSVVLPKENYKMVELFAKDFLVEQYNVFLMLGIKDEAVKFDKYLMKKYKDYYRLSRKVEWIRRTHFILVPVWPLWLQLKRKMKGL